MIYATGDIHAEPKKRLNTASFYEQKDLTKDDYVIILGDFGVIWSGEMSKSEKDNLKWLNSKPFTTLFVDGNHENFDRLLQYPLQNFKGGKARQISDSVWHLARGEVFTINDKKIFAMGGASSHDISGGILDPVEFMLDKKAFRQKIEKIERSGLPYRIRGMSWWPQELPSDEDYKNAKKNLDKHNWEVDFVVSHCCPQSIAEELGGKGMYKADWLTTYFDEVALELKFKKWLFGHYHIDKQVLGKYLCMFMQIVRIA